MNWIAPGLIMIACAAALPAAEPRPAGANRFAPADIEFFEKKVRPLLHERCYRCHSSQAKKLKGGLRLDGRAAILSGGDSGPAVVPGRPDESLLIRAVGYGDAQLQMPPSGKLSDADVAVLREWVCRGVPFPGPAEVAAGGKGTNVAAGRSFWSFQPPRATAPPGAARANWPRKPIDSFVLAEMERHGLRPTPAAARRTLIRRVTFDLVGLPPAPDEVERFVNDPAPDAYERLVEKLLASPLYGERWGRVWLDLARYCDVAEAWSESKGDPWLYRDWVVRAFNEDLPYDRFVERQIAADLIPGADPRDRAALGFLGLSPVYWKELKLAPDVIKTVVAEEWEERIQAVSGTFLGLTVACARCHDHKFDPINQQDYYALAGVLASTRLADQPLLADPQAAPVRQAHARAREIQAQIDKLEEKKPVPPEAKKQVEKLKAQLARVRQVPGFDTPMVPAVEEAGLYVMADGAHRTRIEYKPGLARDVAVQVRGNPANLGPVVPRRFLAVLSPDPPRPFTQGSGRLELARALVTDGSPLASRVIVNRVWKQHFGAGLVETTSDFGAQGARPTHPQLLDDLAARFMAHGWSIKWLHREIVLSATYRQASSPAGLSAGRLEPDTGRQTAFQAQVDPDNRYLWRMNRRRLEVEAWRDAMLAVTGTLDLRQGGPSVSLEEPSNRRRTIYATVKRRELDNLFRLYDFPDPVAHSPGRLPTTTPLQQLFVLNSPFMQQQSAALVQRLKTELPGGTMEARIQRAYHLLYGRAATAAQVKLGVDFLSAVPEGVERERLWQEYAQVLLGSNEFLFVD